MLTGIEQFIIFGFMPLVIGIFAAPERSPHSELTISGEVVIPPSDPLPDNAVITVELVEQRRGEIVLPALARETVAWRGGGIQKFAIRLDRTSVDPLAFYALRARIVADGTVLFETRHPQLAAPLSRDQCTLMLMPV
jgi:putative lipoprotein